jgi:phytoene synthase
VTSVDARSLAPEQVAARSGSNFLVALSCLPAARREGMTAIYAFCRVADDAVDEARDPAEGAGRLRFWHEELERVDRGAPATAIGRSLQRGLRAFSGSTAPLRELLLGMEMDLHGVTYPDLAALEVYCHRVASAVGLACLPVLGVQGAGAEAYAERLGRALQLTNILRDLRPDAEAGRVYAPRDWLRECGVEPEWLRGAGPERAYVRGGPVAALCDRLAAVAAARFSEAGAVLRRLPLRARRRLVPARVMGAVYRDLLLRLQRRGGDVRQERASVPRARKILLMAAACLGVGA